MGWRGAREGGGGVAGWRREGGVGRGWGWSGVTLLGFESIPSLITECFGKVIINVIWKTNSKLEMIYNKLKWEGVIMTQLFCTHQSYHAFFYVTLKMQCTANSIIDTTSHPPFSSLRLGEGKEGGGGGGVGVRSKRCV